MRTIACLLALAACGADEPAADPYKCMASGGAGCFEMPTKPISAADAMGLATTPVLDCAPYEVTSAPVTFTGKTLNMINKAMTPQVRVELFADLAMTQPRGDTMSDDLADYTLAADPMPSQLFARTSSTVNLPLHFLYQRIDVSIAQQTRDFITATRENIGGVIQTVGDSFLPGKSQFFGTAYDCNGNKLVNVIANVSPSSAANNGARVFEAGVKVYYYALDSLNDVALHRRTQARMTSSPGSFVATNIGSGKRYLQIWGFPTEAALAEGSAGLELVGELEVPVPSSESAIVVPIHGRL